MATPFVRSEELQEISEVNVVPLADVSLVLLIILLILSPMMTQAVLSIQAAGKRPGSNAVPSDATVPPQEMILVVGLAPDRITVGDRAFPDEKPLLPFMKAELESRQDKKVFLMPHPDVLHGKVVHMLEVLKSCGAQSVALVQVQEEPDGVRAP
ncbi:MAG: biopolymer transporter ExbD [Elusimicrobiota bacterium]